MMRAMLLTTAAVLTALQPSAPLRAGEPAARLSILTYNVHGLPWPLALGREAAMTAIAARLRRMRANGSQPDVVALQEAFGADAKRIGRNAGYRYAAYGPTAEQAATATAADRAFQAQGSLLRGEGLGKHLDSGLAIFSDHPILATRRIAFSACAGYDCLANKGALAALIAVPGSGPVTIVDTHLNSARASGVATSRHRQAYLGQIRELASFTRSLDRADTIVLVAGDFNVGRDPARNAAFAASVGGARPLTAAAAACGSAADCTVAEPGDVRTSLSRRKDWLLYRPSLSYGVRPFALAAPFGREPDGGMLSDHVGVMVRYGLTRARAGLRVASR